MPKKYVTALIRSKKGRVFLLLLAVLFFIAMALLVKSLLPEEVPKQKKRVQQITMITPPPPPPPPPEMEEPEPEPEEVIEEDIPEEAAPDDGADEPAGEDLGVDADGTAGSDGFGLVAKKGGRGLLGGGGYSSTIKSEINKALLQDEVLKYMDYEVVIKVWVGASGNFEKVDVRVLSGGDRVAEELQRFFERMGGVSKARPLAEQNSWFKYRFRSQT